MARLTVAEPGTFTSVAAERITQAIEHSIAARGRTFVALTGGGTPRDVYAALGDPVRPYRERIDWSRLDLYWGDERHVPPDHPDSNFGMAYRALLQHVPIAPDRIHRIRTELPDPSEAAASYARELPETFDLTLLGLGEDCHIASIFPGSDLLMSWGESSQPRHRGPDSVGATAVFAAHLNAWRITVTPAVILDSRAILMLVTGEKKAPAVAAAIEAPLNIAGCPGQLLRQADDRVEWLLDRDAAGRLAHQG